MRLAPALFLASATLASALASPAALSQARIYCCDDAKGRKVCSDFLPPECSRRAYEERNEKGFVVERKEAPLTPEQMAKREAELAKKAEEEKKKTEERRRNLALLSTYASEKEIDAARDRAIAEIQKQIDQTDKNLAKAVADKAKADKEREFYKNKAIPPEVKKQIEVAEAEVKLQQTNIAARKADIEKTRAKFEDERKKFRELKGIVTPGPGQAVLTAPEAPAAPAAPAGSAPSAPVAPTAPAAPAAPAAAPAR